MRSCEYTTVTGDRRTKLLCLLENLCFFRGEREIRHSHHDLHLANTISITFIFQKNDERDATVTQHRTFDHELCPVTCWAAIVKRILAYPDKGPSTPINTYMDSKGKLKQITSKMTLD
jgi:hypothetical protein